MTKAKILLQLDADPQPSVFDAIVAVDAGVDQLLPYGAVAPASIRDLVHGAIFTRGPADLHNTAVFVGGSDVSAGESILAAVCDTFFGPMRVSVMMDANGANTTAAAAVLAAASHVNLAGITATVLGGTGPVGQRAARLLVKQGARVRVASRRLERAAEVAEKIGSQTEAPDRVTAVQTATPDETRSSVDGAAVLIAAGSAGIQLVDTDGWQGSPELKVAIDLNAVPPAGIEGIAVTDSAKTSGSTVVYGAIGVGGMKMRIHKAAVRQLFERNDLVLDAEQIFELGQSLG